MLNILNFYGDRHPWFDTPVAQSKTSFRVGVINWWSLTAEQATVEKIIEFVDSNDVCFFFSEEIIYSGNLSSEYITQIILELNKRNVFYILFAEDNNIPVNKDRVFYTPWFFKESILVPKSYKVDLDYVPKEYTFNLLLGANKPYRTLIYKLLRFNKNVYSTYRGHPEFKNCSSKELDNADTAMRLLGQLVETTKLNTMVPINVDGQYKSISQVVPVSIYSNTHFDIVTETVIKDHHQFLTEKTAKPLATGRFFCGYMSPYFKNHLAKHGFSFETYPTFTNYDSMFDNVMRLNALVEEIEIISNDSLLVQDIYEKTREERRHNMEVFKNKTSNFMPEITAWMHNVIQNGGL
jgi:hypothetical protein